MLTVDEAITAITHYRRLHGHSDGTARLDAWVLKTLGKSPQEASVADLEAIVLRSDAKATRASYASRIRSTFTALRDMGLITNRADEQLPKLRWPKTLPRPLTDHQVRVLLAGMARPHLDVVRVALLTGARAMECWAMSGVDLHDGANGPELLLHGKGGKEATVPAHPTVVAILNGYGTLGRIWPGYKSPRCLSHEVGWEMRHVLGVKGVEFHQCRHTFGTRVYQATGDLYLTARLMRHSSVNSTQGYAQIADTKPRAAVELLAG